MDAQDRTAAYPVINRLYEHPHRFDFFTAVRRLENCFPARPRVGHSRTPADDPIRFCQNPSLSFPPSTLERLEFGRDSRPPRLFVHFMGLLGPNGPLPLQLTAYARERQLARDNTLARFLDVFNHRMVSLFYRAWASAQQAVQYERGLGDRAEKGTFSFSAQQPSAPQGGEKVNVPFSARAGDDRFAVYVAALFGIGMPSLRHRDAAPDVAKLHYSGRLACQTRHAEGLRALLEDYFRIRVNIEEFVGQWIDIPPDCRCRVGETPRTGLVGRTAIVGSRMWDCQQKFRLRFGPMRLADYERMLPGGGSLVRLAAWVRNYIGDELSWDLQLILKREEVPTTRMGQYGRLGWTTWLQSKPLDRDADDLVLRPGGA
ncbi:MAG: type VI secretion system baseplate subunit TssG [Planctomycetes bacterium]|nr:type VI secretion system baseplate subunit TssG [Planctomycetota bacterium]